MMGRERDEGGLPRRTKLKELAEQAKEEKSGHKDPNYYMAITFLIIALIANLILFLHYAGLI